MTGVLSLRSASNSAMRWAQFSSKRSLASLARVLSGVTPNCSACIWLSSFWWAILRARAELLSVRSSISLLSLLMYSQMKWFCCSCLRKAEVISSRSPVPLSSLISSKLFQMAAIVLRQFSTMRTRSLFCVMSCRSRYLTSGCVSVASFFCSISLFRLKRCPLRLSSRFPRPAPTSSRKSFASFSFSAFRRRICCLLAANRSFFCWISPCLPVTRADSSSMRSVSLRCASFWLIFSLRSSSISPLKDLLRARTSLQELMVWLSSRSRIFSSACSFMVSVLKARLLSASSSFAFWAWSRNTSLRFSCRRKNLRLSCSSMRVQLSISRSNSCPVVSPSRLALLAVRLNSRLLSSSLRLRCILPIITILPNRTSNQALLFLPAQSAPQYSSPQGIISTCSNGQQSVVQKEAIIGSLVVLALLVLLDLHQHALQLDSQQLAQLLAVLLVQPVPSRKLARNLLQPVLVSRVQCDPVHLLPEVHVQQQGGCLFMLFCGRWLLLEAEVLGILAGTLATLEELLLMLAVLPALLHAVQGLLDLLGVIVAGVSVDLGVGEGRGEGTLLEVCILTLAAETKRLLLVLQVAVVVVELEGLLVAKTALAAGDGGVVHGTGQRGGLEGALLHLFLARFLLPLLLLEFTGQVVEDEQVGVRNHAVSRDAVVELGIVLQQLVHLLQHLLSVPFCKLLAGLIYAWVVVLLRLFPFRLPLFLLRFLSPCLAKQSVPLEEVEVFLQLAALGLVEGELKVGGGGFAFLEVDGVDVVDADDGEQEDADVLGVDLVALEGLVGLVDERAFEAVLALLLYPREPHLLQDLVEQHVLDLSLRRGRHVQPFHHSEVLLDELLRHVLLVVQIEMPLLPDHRCAAHRLHLLRPLLPPKGVLVEEVVNGCVSRQFLGLICDARVKVVRVLLVVFCVLLVLERVEAVEDGGVGGGLVVRTCLVDLGVEGAGVLLGVEGVLEGGALLGDLARELVLLVQELVEGAFLALLVRGLGLEGALRVETPLLLLLQLADLALLLRQPPPHLLADVLLLPLQRLDASLLPRALFLHQPLQILQHPAAQRPFAFAPRRRLQHWHRDRRHRLAHYRLLVVVLRHDSYYFELQKNPPQCPPHARPPNCLNSQKPQLPSQGWFQCFARRECQSGLEGGEGEWGGRGGRRAAG